MEHIMSTLLDRCQNVISKILPRNYYMDDCGYSEDRFRVAIYRDYGMRNGVPKTEFVTDFIFIYDKQDYIEEGITLDEQYTIWMKDVVYWLEQRFEIYLDKL